jgi:hypothetical protein
MEFELYPLASTACDWSLFTSVMKKKTGESPTETLGETLIDLETPSAFLACLDLENHPLHHLRTGTTKSTFLHFYVTFLCFSNKELISELCLSSPNLKIYHKKYIDFYISIITANMSDWYKIVVQNLKEESPLLIRQFYHQILYNFDIMGFREIWSKHPRILLNDGTICLK